MLARTVLTVIVSLSIFSGCASLKAAPSKGAGFVPVQQMAKAENLPFNKSWIRDDFAWKNYKSIYISPVKTQFLMGSSDWQQHFRKDKMKEDSQEIARYMESRFKEGFRNDPNKRLQVVDSPAPGSLTLELALTELVPGNVALELLGYAPYGGGAAVKLLERATGAVSTVAFEAKLKESGSDKTLAMFADREQQKYSPLDFRGLSWYGNARRLINEWADQFVEIANTEPGGKVEESSPFTLMPF
jgi:hypothetical protein